MIYCPTITIFLAPAIVNLFAICLKKSFGNTDGKMPKYGDEHVKKTPKIETWFLCYCFSPAAQNP
jgi:hypothetical protein